jgi:hypothetical protein
MAIIVADVFISYARIDRPFARRLADALEARGWSVWWDYRNLRGGQHFHRIIEEAISTARVVVVVWSKTSIESRWVRDEATLALEEDKLVPLRIDMARLPMRFRNIHTIDLVSWTGEAEAEPFERLVEDLGHYLGPSISPSSTQATVPKPPASTGDAAAAQVAYHRWEFAAALSLAQPAAERGDQVAQYILGLLYDDGRGVAQDYAEAVCWYRKAADQGHAAAQYNIGWLYMNGRGVAQDMAQARAWMQKAAAVGDEDAKKWLARN